MTDSYENGYIEADSLFENTSDEETMLPVREHCFCLNDFFAICAELWRQKHRFEKLEVLADKLFYVDRHEMSGLLAFMLDRFSDGAYSGDSCTASFGCAKPDGRLYVTLASGSCGLITRLCFERREFIMPETVGEAAECEMLREDIEKWLAEHEREP